MPKNPITSRQNERVKQAAKLRQRRQRDKQGRFLIDGAREIDRAMDAGIEILEAFVCETFCTSAESQTVVDRLSQTGADLAEVTPPVFEKLCYGRREDGVVVVAAAVSRTLAGLHLPPQPLVVVLESLEKPGNVGAILRSADGAGVDAVILADPCSDLFNPNTIRASLGTVFRSNVCTATSEEAIGWLNEKRLTIFAARPDAARVYTEVDFQAGGAIVLGSEAEGLSQLWRRDEVLGVRLPMRGAADSLNVSATAAVLFYEARRQRNTTRVVNPLPYPLPRRRGRGIWNHCTNSVSIDCRALAIAVSIRRILSQSFLYETATN